MGSPTALTQGWLALRLRTGRMQSAQRAKPTGSIFFTSLSGTSFRA